jgi:anti-sigma regulatory factor (Ser/Thr protein kinase)
VGLQLATALACPGAATGIGLAASLEEKPGAGAIYIAGVAVATVLGGLAAGLLASGLSFLAIGYFFVAPTHQLQVGGRGVALLVAFPLAALVVGFLLERSKRAQERAARALAREREVAEALQRGMLEPVPALDTVEIAVRYLPGSPGLDIGGDWYDVYELSSGEVFVSLGDVVGRGLEAAAAMARLRTTLRAYAFEGRGPAACLELLNGVAGERDFATVVAVLLDPVTGEARTASAGHLPPIVVEPSGAVQLLEGAEGLPLGAVTECGYTERRLELAPGASLLLYTDGLIERRQRTLDEGLELLRRAAAAGGTGPEALVDRLVAELVPGEYRSDDVAVLALRPRAPVLPGLRVETPAAPGSLAELREALRTWLARVRVPAADAYELLVASGEACTNAVEHAGGSRVELEARLAAGAVEVEVRDDGSWRPRDAASAERGRGLALMEALADRVEVVAGERGTSVTLLRRVALDGQPAASVRSGSAAGAGSSDAAQ